VKASLARLARRPVTSNPHAARHRPLLPARGQRGDSDGPSGSLNPQLSTLNPRSAQSPTGIDELRSESEGCGRESAVEFQSPTGIDELRSGSASASPHSLLLYFFTSVILFGNPVPYGDR